MCFFLGCSVNCCFPGSGGSILTKISFWDADSNPQRYYVDIYVEQVAVHELIQSGDGTPAKQLRSIETS